MPGKTRLKDGFSPSIYKVVDLFLCLNKDF